MERPKTNWVERKNFISLAIEASSWNWFDKVSVECMQMALLDIGSSWLVHMLILYFKLERLSVLI